jgi:hypothetical protein
LENLLENLRVLELLLNLGDDALSQFLLLSLLDLSLVANPRVEDSLGLCGKSSSLFELKSLGLKLSGFLAGYQ